MIDRGNTADVGGNNSGGGSDALTLEILTAVTATDVEQFNRLVSQLSSSAAALDEASLGAVVDHPACDVLVARDGGVIVGSLTLVTFPIPTGTRAWIEDVVVDGDVRGRGVGGALNRFALERARELGAKTVDLTSRPSREAANRLYQSLGFVARETNVYRYDLRA